MNLPFAHSKFTVCLLFMVICVYCGKFTIGFTAAFRIKKTGSKKMTITDVNGKLLFVVGNPSVVIGNSNYFYQQ